MQEALTSSGRARLTWWLKTGEKRSPAQEDGRETDAFVSWKDTITSSLPEDGKVGKRNVLGGGKAFLPFEQIPTETRKLANLYHAEERAFLEQILEQHSSRNGFQTRFGWWEDDEKEKYTASLQQGRH